MIGLRGKVALLTGAAGGIGRAICARFIREGIQVAAADIDADSLAKMAEEMDCGSDQLRLLVLDITVVSGHTSAR